MKQSVSLLARTVTAFAAVLLIAAPVLATPGGGGDGRPRPPVIPTSHALLLSK